MREAVSVGEGYSQEFEVKVGFQKGSVLSPLLFIIVLEALLHEFLKTSDTRKLLTNTADTDSSADICNFNKYVKISLSDKKNDEPPIKRWLKDA